MVAHSPLHGSRRAELPHRAPASGDDAKSPRGIGVADAGRGQPAVDEPPHALPGEAGLLAAPPERTVPELADPVADEGYSLGVHGHAVVAHVPANEGLGLALTSALPVRRRERAELDEARLVGVQFQGELAEPLGQRFSEPPGIGLVLESYDHVVRIAPVNASPLPSRAAAHDSGPSWVASPPTYDSFIHNTSPV